MASAEKTAKGEEGQKGVSPPAITLPKGGGAIRGMGEKFAANPVTGTGSMSVPIAVSPGRAGFGPQLSLAYDSGAGNGPFGFGWSLSLPAITRKTDKGLPRYFDGEESDVFILSGAEDLVPEFRKDANGQWVMQDGEYVICDDLRLVDGVTYRVRRYRPRIEGLFARIERWTNPSDATDVFWRSISKDNVTTWYGRTAESRIADPADPARIFTWLICESHDDKGNVIAYRYEKENSAGVGRSQVHERNRTDLTRSANRYLKRIFYGNRRPYFPQSVLDYPPEARDQWLFQVVLDYGEHDQEAPTPTDGGAWLRRTDPFSSYRAGFEVRTYRLCQRVLMFHHIPELPTGETGYDGLVRSTDFAYSCEQNPSDVRNPIYSFLLSVTQTGYKRTGATSYLKRSLPPVEFDYTRPIVQGKVEEVDSASLENLPAGLDGTVYQWTDLHGEGIPGILTEQVGGWFYKRNLSPIAVKQDTGAVRTEAQFAPMELVATKPNLTLTSGAQFMDLAGDGQPDLVVLDGPMPGLYEHDDAEGWQPFRPFAARLSRDTRDPNLKFVDLDGDGHADVLITEYDALVWHVSLAEEGFGPARRSPQALDEEKGPRLVFADGTQSIYLADLSGDGLTDLARISNGEICYWPNLGYGRFGAKVTMDHAPWFDNADQFDQKRIRLADIDGSGTTDIIYLHCEGVRVYFNQSGNSWGAAQSLAVFPRIDNLAAITATDLLGNGTACLVWSSPLPGDGRRPMRYVNLMGGTKPHLLVKTVNNLGAETRAHYAPSTKFYLQDKRDGRPWITRLPFPVHVVERVETYDAISRNRFVTRYAYHHGYFDGEEREFRGFGMVEQQDTEELAALTGDGTLPAATNLDAASHVPPVLTKTWFHTGIFVGRDHVSDFFAGLLDKEDLGEYYREPGLTDAQARDLLLPDTELPAGLTMEEQREACRALKGSMLRQEVYALDGTAKANHPYTVAEQNFTVERLQPRDGNRHGVFFTHSREAITYHYERNPADPRIGHALTLEVDPFGNVLKSLAVGYGRRTASTDPTLTAEDKAKQTRLLITYTENGFTNAIGDATQHPDDYRTPLSAETRTYELTGFTPEKGAARFSFGEWTRNSFALLAAAEEIHYEETVNTSTKQKRLIEHVRTLYRPDDLGMAQFDPLALLPLGTVEPLALPGKSYKLAFTSKLAEHIFGESGKLTPAELDSVLADEGRYVHSEGDANWWIPSGRTFYFPCGFVTALPEVVHARNHFFLPRRFRDPFHTNTVSTESCITYDSYDLLMVETRDPLDNRVTVGERRPDGALDPSKPGNDYRVLQPWRVTDPNGNRAAVAFDALGMVAGTAIMGKATETLGDVLDAAFEADLAQSQLDAFMARPREATANPNESTANQVAHDLLGNATTRIVYDLDCFRRLGQPPFAATIARETHVGDLQPGQLAKLQISFSYSDGFGREIQKKIQAEPGPAPKRDANGNIVVGAGGQPEMTDYDVSPRWVGSGWTIFNNKGKPIRQYEPFFTDAHGFEFGVQVGVSPVLIYDPTERVVATLHPNHTWEKVVFDPWQQTTYDVNDTVLNADGSTDPKLDPDVKGFFERLPDADYLPTWYEQRIALPASDPERIAAGKAASHRQTPTVAHLDTLGRPFLTIAHNRFERNGAPVEEAYPTRVELDIEGNQRAVRDAIVQNGDAQGRIVMRYDYDMLGNRIHQLSMEAGARWTLGDVAGKPIRAWDSRGHSFCTEYDPLRRPLRSFVAGADPAKPDTALLTERLVYGEQHPEAELRNLRGKLYLHLDQAGAAASKAHDFKGNLLSGSRRLATEYKQALSWDAVDASLPGDAKVQFDPMMLEAALAPQLEADAYTSLTSYDALNRPVTLTTPHTPAMPPNVIRPGYNEANLLERLDANLRSEQVNGQPVWTSFVADIDYDAKGQRLLIGYGNGVTTTYSYDPSTFRLVHLLTRRPSAAFAEDCPQNPPAGWPGCQVQNLHYTYDPAGNITQIRDSAQQTIYFSNQRVEPSATYTYDATYRLIEATGREHLGQTAGQLNPPTPPDALNAFHTRLNHPGNGDAMGTYTEQYVYDAVGNFLQMQHRGSDPAQGWTRSYAYDETSLTEPSKQNNRLSSTTVGSGTAQPYTYDAHGNMTRMPHLPLMLWDYRDQQQATSQQVADNGIPETTYYVYDAGGQRVRKVTERAVSAAELASGKQPTRMKERIYLGGFEIYREYNGSAGTALALQRETLHIMDGKRRIALVETKTIDASVPANTLPETLIRYQFGNHLGSASLELDDQAQIISYEEYTAYGNTSYQAMRALLKTPKLYRYTGKERDEESGLYYHGARYYAPWLGRWTACDLMVLVDGPNMYRYVRGNPIQMSDPSGWAGVHDEISSTCRTESPECSPQNEMSRPSDMSVQGVPDRQQDAVAQDAKPKATPSDSHDFFGEYTPAELEYYESYEAWRISPGWAEASAKSARNHLTAWKGALSPSAGPPSPFALMLKQGATLGSMKTELQADQKVPTASKGGATNLKAAEPMQAQEPSASTTPPARNLPGYYPDRPGTVNVQGQLALPADPKALALYNASNKTSDLLVIGRKWDTDVAAAWPGHQVIGSALTSTKSGPWTPTKNNAWIQGGIDRGAPFYLATSPSNKTLQPTEYGVLGYDKFAPRCDPQNKSALRAYFLDSPGWGPTVTQKEIEQLFSAGYVLQGNTFVHK